MTNIVILSHERPRLLRQCIDSIYASTPQEEFTCTVVDDNSQDFRTKKYLHSITHKNFALLEVQNSGHIVAQLKNLGVFYSRQRFGTPEWLYIGDSDTAFLPGWLSLLKDTALYSEGFGYRLWGGQIHPFHRPLRSESLTFSADRPQGAEWTEHSVLDGPSWFMRWRTWRKIGPFSRTCAPGACKSEDAEWCLRLTHPVNGGSYRDVERPSSGYRIGVTSPHCVIHTGLTQSNSQDAPGAEERRKLIPPGVLAE